MPPQNLTIEGTNHSDLIVSGRGDDVVSGGNGNDLILTGNGNDTVDGGDGNDLILSGNGDDTVEGGDGDDTIFGGGGDDRITGGDGSDHIYGGGGTDIAIFAGDIQDYDITTTHRGIQVTDHASGATDDLHGIEILEFDNGTFVLDQNNAPVADNVAVGVGEDGPAVAGNLISAANAFDFEGDALTIVGVDGNPASVGTQITLASGALLTVNGDGTYAYDPNGHFESLGAGDTAADTITFDIFDGTNTITRSLTVTVNGVDDPPVVDQGISNQTVDEDNPWTFAVPADAFSDVDTASLSLSATLADGSDLPAWLSFDGTTFTGTPPQDFNGDIGLKVTASDGTASADTEFTLTVNPVNDPPVADTATITSYDPGDTFSFNILDHVTDVDGDALSALALTGDGLSLVSNVGGVQVYQGHFSLNPSDETTLTLDTHTGEVTVDTETLTSLILGQVGHPPTEETTSPAFSFVVQVSDGTATANAGITIDEAVHTVSDSTTTDPGDVTIAPFVDPVNFAPLTQADSASTVEDNPTPIVINVLDNDTDIDGGTLAVSGATALHGTATTDGTTVSYTPDPDFFGSDTITYTAIDGQGGQSPGTVIVDVSAVNDPPVLTGTLTAAIDEGAGHTITTSELNFADPDDGAADVTFTAANLMNGALVVDGTAATTFTGQQLADGLVSFTHDGSETTVASFDVSVEDGNEDGSTPVAQPFAFTVNPVNDAPVGVPAILGDVEVDAALSADTTGISDADGLGAFSYQWQSSPDGTAWQPIADATGSGFTPTSAEVGDELRVVVSYTDGEGFAESIASDATAAVSGGAVLVVLHAPTANPDSNGTDSVIEAGDLGPGDPNAAGNVLDNDSDPDAGDTLSVVGVVAGHPVQSIPSTGVGAPIVGTYGMLTVDSNGDWTYHLNNADPDTDGLGPSQTGHDIFTYTVSDNHGLTDTSTVNISIQGSADTTGPGEPGIIIIIPPVLDPGDGHVIVA